MDLDNTTASFQGMFHTVDFMADDLGLLITPRSGTHDGSLTRGYYIYASDIPALKAFVASLPTDDMADPYYLKANEPGKNERWQ